MIDPNTGIEYPDDPSMLQKFNMFMNTPGAAMMGAAMSNLGQIGMGAAPTHNPFMAMQQARAQNQQLMQMRALQLDRQQEREQMRRLRDLQMQRTQGQMQRESNPAWEYESLRDGGYLPEGMTYEDYVKSPYAGRSGASSKAFAPIIGSVGDTKKILMPTYDPTTGAMTMVQQDLPEGFVEDSGIEKIDTGNVINMYRKSDGAFLGSMPKNLTPAQETSYLDAAARAQTGGKQAQEEIGNIYEQQSAIASNIANYDEAIRLVDAGAETGAISRLFPSFRAATVELENLANRLGLDVVAGGKFGALSEGELRLALNTAMPDNLNGPELRDWLVRKRDAQNRLRLELLDSASFLNSGGTLGDLLEQKQGKAPTQQGPGGLKPTHRYNPATGRVEPIQ